MSESLGASHEGIEGALELEEALDTGVGIVLISLLILVVLLSLICMLMTHLTFSPPMYVRPYV